MTYKELLDHLNSMTTEELKEEVMLEFTTYDPEFHRTIVTDSIHIHRSLDDMYVLDRDSGPLTEIEIEEAGGTTEGLFLLLYRGQTYMTAEDRTYYSGGD